MKVTLEMSTLVIKIRYFSKPETCMYYIFIYSGLDRVSVIRTDESARKNLFLNIFINVFEY